MLQIERTENAIAAIKAARERLAARAEEVAEKRKAVGFDMYDAVDAKSARKRLDELNAELAAIHEEMEGADAALAEGERRLLSARAAQAARAARYQAEKLAEEMKVFEQCGVDLDHALATLVTASRKMKDSLGRMHALGQVTPSKQQFDTLGRNALFNALVNSIWRQYFPNTLLSPDRQSFGSLTKKWMAGIRAQVEKRMAA